MSILQGTKKNLGIAEDNTAFDDEILTGINTAFSTLTGMGLGPEDGFTVTAEDDPDWDEFEADPKYNSIKTYVQLQTKLLFDSSSMTSYVLAALERQLEELGWRLHELSEGDRWTPPEEDA